jgi:hypothetical protein
MLSRVATASKHQAKDRARRRRYVLHYLLSLGDLTRCQRVFSTPTTVWATRDRKLALRLPDLSVIVVLRRSLKTVILMAPTPQSHVLQRPRCMAITAATSNLTRAMASQTISFIILLPYHHFIYVSHLLEDLNPQ